jgi:hypothetical protein
MGSAVNASGATSEVLKSAESNMDKLVSALKSDYAQAAVDLAGIVDPTPISDLLGAGLSLARGDPIGAGLSLISIVPYVGDALAKTGKATRLAKSISDLRKKIEATSASINKIRVDRKAAAALERAKRKKDAADKAVQKKKCLVCSDEDEIYGKYGTRLPRANGKWEGEPGNSKWYPDPDTDKGASILAATKGKPIEFKEGYPDFTPHSIKSVEIDMKGTDVDFDSANKAAGFSHTPKGYTWHHHEDGVTMQLVPSDINNNLPHMGGASIVKGPEY